MTSEIPIPAEDFASIAAKLLLAEQYINEIKQDIQRVTGIDLVNTGIVIQAERIKARDQRQL